MTPLWIALILIPAGAAMLFYIFKTAWPKPPEDDDDDIWDEPSEEDFDEDAEEKEIVDIADGTARPNVSRPPITMTSRGAPRKRAELPARPTLGAAKTEAASSDRMSVANLQKIAEKSPVAKSGPTVAANGQPIKPKR